jgi:hypothetical protein
MLPVLTLLQRMSNCFDDILPQNQREHVFLRAEPAITNQLIVGPCVWAYQVLRQTLGERFIENFQMRIFINHFFSK